MNFLNLIFKTGGMMKKLILVVIGLFLFTSLVFASGTTYTNVKTNNGNNNGYIFVGTGTMNGGVQVGNWQDPTTIPSLKGAKGDKGDTGSQGIQGIKGDKGEQGIQGITGKDGMNGINGLNGINGIDGQQGIQGAKGDKGDKGDNGKDVDPQTVLNLQNTDNQLNTSILDEVNNRILGDNNLFNLLGTETFERINGDNQLQNNLDTETTQRKQVDKKLNKKINRVNKESIKRDNVLQDNINTVDINSKDRDNTLQNNLNTETIGRVNGDNFLNSKILDTEKKIDNLNSRVGKLEKTQVNIRTEVKFIREKHLEVGVYSTYSTTRSVCSEVGLNIVIPLGDSYLDRENKKINARLDRIDKQLGNSTVITKTIDNKGKIKSLQISQGQLSVNGEF
jgi:hypothetical protein